MIYTLYHLLFFTVILITWPLWLWRYLTTPKYRGTVAQRLGWIVPACPPPSRRIWVHAVSVGEVMAARGLIQCLATQFPQDGIVLSTVTKTGQQVARETLPELQARFYLPLDIPWILRRVVHAVQPRCLIVMETELWPGLFHIMEQKKIPVVLVNGRLSPGSFRNYRKFFHPMKRFLRPVHLFAMQSRADAQRMAAIGAPEARIQVTGNIKYDQAMRLPDATQMARLAVRVPRPKGIVWVAASTHPGEEEAILTAFTQLRDPFPSLHLILVPRHPERCDAVATQIRQHGWQAWRFSHTGGTAASDATPSDSAILWDRAVLLVDQVGWLTRLYGYAHVVFVGGSLVPHGGQNMLEPSAWGIPPLFGPHTFHFKEITRQLLEAEAAIQIPHPNALQPALHTLLRDAAHRQAMGRRAKEVVAANVGALQRTMAAIQSVWPSDSSHPPCPPA